jgi:hypothetical protein
VSFACKGSKEVAVALVFDAIVRNPWLDGIAPYIPTEILLSNLVFPVMNEALHKMWKL